MKVNQSMEGENMPVFYKEFPSTQRMKTSFVYVLWSWVDFKYSLIVQLVQRVPIIDLILYLKRKEKFKLTSSATFPVLSEVSKMTS